MKNIIAWLRRNADKVDACYDDCFYGVYLGHKIRLGGDCILDVGFEDFDRWANSTAYSTKITNKNIARQVNLSITEARNNKSEPDWYDTMRFINAIFNK